MYLKQGKFKGHLTSYLRPLDSSVWGGLVILIVTSGILTKIFEKLLTGKLNLNVFLIFDLIQSTFKSLQVFCSQAITDIPTSNSIRILYLMKLFVFVIFFQAYCGYLVSSLTIAVPYFPFMDLKGFFDNKEYQLMTIRKGFQRYFYKKVIGEGQREDFMIADDDLPEDAEAAIHKLCTQKHLAFVDFRESVLDIDKFTCKVAELPSPVANVYMGIASPRNFPFREYISRELLHFGSTGIRKRITAHLSTNLDFRHKKDGEEYVTVSIAEVFSVFILLTFGMFVSLLIFLVEVFLAEGVKSHIKKNIFQKNKVQKKRKRVSFHLITVKNK